MANFGICERLMVALAVFCPAAVCLFSPSKADAATPRFKLVTVSATRHCVEADFIERLERLGFAIEKPEVRYRFFAELPDPVIRVKRLRFSRVRLANGEELELDAIHLAGRTFAGIRHTYSDSWGVDLDHTGRRLMIDLVLGRQQVDDLFRVEGQIEMVHGQGPRTIQTGRMDEERGARDEKTGAAVTFSMKWGIRGRNIQLEVPIPRDRLGSVQVLDDQDRPLPFIEPHYYDLIPLGAKGTVIKLFVEKPEGTPFKLELNTFEESRQETVPFSIENVLINEPRPPGSASKAAPSQ